MGVRHVRADGLGGQTVNDRLGDSTLTTLKDFQRNTVVHALDRLYDADDATGRFLVADEVGTGKTHVAKGVIAGAIDRLNVDSTVNRIDVIYVCSNAAIAQQNVAKLGSFAADFSPLSTRITMLAAQAHGLNRAVPGKKTVNVIAFTPGTSFEQGFARGRVEERALIFQMLKDMIPEGRSGLRCLLRMDVATETWKMHVDRLSSPGAIDLDIRQRFQAAVQKASYWDDLHSVLESLRGKAAIPADPEKRRRATGLVRKLRTTLAKASIDALEPDLVILDEFQRFKHLLETPEEDVDDGDIKLLAQQLFTYPGVRVLLLSATPYKLFTFAGEAGIAGDDHYRDFLATTRFLVRDDPAAMNDIERTFSEFRVALIEGKGVVEARERAQACLRRVMSRTERPTADEYDMAEEAETSLGVPTPDELVGYVAMDRFANDLDTAMPVEYWKSAPYFLNFMDGYQIGEKFKESFQEGTAPTVPGHAKVLKPAQITRREAIDPCNARLRRLQEEVVDSGLWRLLWLPPSLSYLSPGGPFADVDPVRATKRLIFSSWAAAPNSIAALISHEVLRRILGEEKPDETGTDREGRLGFETGSDLGQGMTTLALVTPIPVLARVLDPLAFAREAGDALLGLAEVLPLAVDALRPHLPRREAVQARIRREAWYWAAPFMMADESELIALLSEADGVHSDPAEGSKGRRATLEAAIGARTMTLGATPEDLEEVVAMLGMFGPGNVAYRALRRVVGGLGPTETTLISAATIIGEGFRSLFNRREASALVDLAHPKGEGPYWRRVLAYCADGDLQAVLDEYLGHMVDVTNGVTDKDIIAIATKIRSAISLRRSDVRLFNPSSPQKGFDVDTHFALRFGSAKGKMKVDDDAVKRMGLVKDAFNSPFWPMVLASTSVGQEGVDFHWWCHSLVHWNLPSNPVDLEQREGRIHRFSGHAVRKNVAATYRAAALKSDDANPWAALFQCAVDARTDEVADRVGDLWPWWVFPGKAKIRVWTPVLPFSKDEMRWKQLKRLRAMYRLAFGQPRQGDLIELVADKGVDKTPLDLRPPRR
jgi:hypothetical protein